MKKTTLVSSALLTVMTLASASMGAVHAATVTPATSTADVTFEANDDKTTPVDPTDPSKPVDPSKPTDPADTPNPGTGNMGPLSIDYVSNLKFGTQKIKDSAYFSTNTNPYIQITDKRGTGAGWVASAAISDFTGTKDSKPVTLAGAELTLNNGLVKTATTNAAVAPTTDKKITLGKTNTAIMTAAKDAGQGTWLNVFGGKEDVALSVPAGNITSGVTYNATITWTLGDTPQG